MHVSIHDYMHTHTSNPPLAVPSSAPQNVTLSTETVNELTISWDRPPEISINGILTFYSLRYHRLRYDDYTFISVNGSQERTVLRGLESYTVYEVFIAATTVNGTGPFISHTALTAEDGNNIIILLLLLTDMVTLIG